MEQVKKKNFLTRYLEQRTTGERVLYTIVFILFVLYAITLVTPFAWLGYSSFKYFIEYQTDSALGKIFDLPDKWYFQNYIDAFSLLNVDGVTFIGMFWNSIWQSVISIAVSVVVSTSFSYSMAKFRFPGRDAIYTLIITIMIIPIMSGSGAGFKLWVNLGLYDTPMLMIVSALGFGNFLYYYSFFKSVSDSYAEAVYLDGGGEFTAFFKIVFPQATPMVFALSIMSFIAKWNDYLNILLLLPSYPTIASGMYVVKNTMLRTGKDTIYYAGTIISVVPVIIIFCSFSDLIMNNMSIGGLKG